MITIGEMRTRGARVPWGALLAPRRRSRRTGAREAGFARLYGPLGAVAASLLVWLTQIVVSLVGGVLPLPAAVSPAATPPPKDA